MFGKRVGLIPYTEVSLSDPISRLGTQETYRWVQQSLEFSP